MGFIKDNLLDNEELIYRTKLHWMVFKWPIIFFAIAFAMAWSTIPDQQAGAVLDESTLGVMGLFGLLGIISAIHSFISYMTSEFGITDKRVLMKTGFIRRKSYETLLNKVEGIHIDQGILGRILGYGTIVVRGTGGSSNAFEKIKEPLAFRRRVQERIDT